MFEVKRTLQISFIMCSMYIRTRTHDYLMELYCPSISARTKNPSTVSLLTHLQWHWGHLCWGGENPHLPKKQPTKLLVVPLQPQPYKSKTFRSHSYSRKRLQTPQAEKAAIRMPFLCKINSMGENLLHSNECWDNHDLECIRTYLTSSIWTT